VKGRKKWQCWDVVKVVMYTTVIVPMDPVEVAWFVLKIFASILVLQLLYISRELCRIKTHVMSHASQKKVLACRIIPTVYRPNGSTVCTVGRTNSTCKNIAPVPVCSWPRSNSTSTSSVSVPLSSASMPVGRWEIISARLAPGQYFDPELTLCELQLPAKPVSGTSTIEWEY